MRRIARLITTVLRQPVSSAVLAAGAAALALAGPAARAQTAGCAPGITFCVETQRVVLHVTVVDRQDRFVTDLEQSAFSVAEDDQRQSLTYFAQEDVPVSIGLVIDNSGSMRDKRRLVNAAALEFVKASNRQDEVFVVNFNDESYLDQDFTSDIDRLQDALQRIDTRGGTALYDATSMSLDHLVEAGNKEYNKRALLIITDGEDTSSRMDLEILVRKLQSADVTVYGIGLLAEQERRAAKRAERHLRTLTRPTGGPAYFPASFSEVEPLVKRIAADIRNQYIVEYNRPVSKPAGYRRIRIELKGPARSNKVRHRPGYYAD
ncbi:MAG: VWA domain-containing protein [Bryobacterales bacterium]|nr:VWA domain-containing protein [Bryobacterales bacterium]